MRRFFSDLLVSVLVDVPLIVDRQQRVRVDGYQDGTCVCLCDREEERGGREGGGEERMRRREEREVIRVVDLRSQLVSVHFMNMH